MNYTHPKKASKKKSFRRYLVEDFLRCSEDNFSEMKICANNKAEQKTLREKHNKIQFNPSQP